MKKGIALLIGAAFLMMLTAVSQAALYSVFAKDNSSTGGVGLATITLSTGQLFNVAVDPKDLWNAGPLPRWSNADGLTGNLYATGSDESGQSAGTLIGQSFGLYTQKNFSAPYGSLVGQIGSGNYFLIGTNYSAVASAGGTLYLYYWDSNNNDNTEKIVANVNVVPIPAAAWLLGTGLLGLVVIRRRMKR
jgi:hypothetical protein